jgi:hypothetical protein
MKVADPPKDDQLIVPGWRIGKVYLGMTSAALLAAMGEPDETTHPDRVRIERSGGLLAAKGEPDETTPLKITNFIWFEWKRAGIRIIHNMDADQVAFIDVKRDSYRTAEGVHIGMSELAVSVKLGRPKVSYFGEKSEKGVYCYKKGIIIVFNNAAPHNVEWITVKPRKNWWQQDLQCESYDRARNITQQGN